MCLNRIGGAKCRWKTTKQNSRTNNGATVFTLFGVGRNIDIKYLRKSRFDRDYADLSIEETLKRHEIILDKLANERGYHIAKTYYEVVSGESIAARPEIQKMLEEVSAGIYAGVLVVDPFMSMLLQNGIANTT